jgi:parallel beta-helix repeat protein
MHGFMSRANRRRGLALGLALILAGCYGKPPKEAEKPPDPTPVPVADACMAVVPASSTVFNVTAAPYNADATGATDATAAIQAAINAAGGTGGTVLIPDGTYKINPVAVSTSGSHGIALKSNMTLKMTSGASLQAIGVSSSSYVVVLVSAVSNVNIVGGTIIGERATHSGSGGEAGMGLSITGSQHVVVQGVTAKECWGDGFYVTNASSDVSFCGVTSDHNRRAGISITSVNGLSIKNSIFKNTTGTLPEAGLNIEPNPGETASYISISTGCVFSNNAGGGIQTGVPISSTGSAFVIGVVIDGNTFTGNGVNPIDGFVGQKSGILVTNSNGTQVTNNTVTGTSGRGILLRSNATNSMVKSNVVSSNTASGIYLSACSGSALSSNTGSGNSGPGIFQESGNGATVDATNNVVGGPGSP